MKKFATTLSILLLITTASFAASPGNSSSNKNGLVKVSFSKNKSAKELKAAAAAQKKIERSFKEIIIMCLLRFE
jgi:hypothetical protein